MADDSGWVAPPRRERDRRPDRRPRDATAVTEMLRERPTWEGEAPAPGEQPTTRIPDPSNENTTRLPDPSEERTTRLPDPSEEGTARLFDDPSRAETTRLPDDPPTDRPRRRRPGDHPPLFDDDPPR